jgi:hypothetical protein
MPGPIMHQGAGVLCAHGGQALPMAPMPRVLVSGMPVVTVGSPYSVVACGLTGTSAPPCVTGQWIVGAVRVLAGGMPLAVATGSSTTVAPGTPMLPVSVQPRAVAT